MTAAKGAWQPDAWDGYVRGHPRGTYLQTTAWARIKRATGWSATHVGSADEAGPVGMRVGAQVLWRQIPMLPWRFAYAPRGPLADAWDERTHHAWADQLRSAARRGGRLEGAALLRMDPELEHSEAVVRALAGSGWRRAHDMQPRRTRIVDLTAGEDVLWSGLRKKWRQYVNKARTNGVTVRDVDPAAEPAAFEQFHAVMRDVSKRTALPLRSAEAYRRIWAAFAPAGESRVLFAERDGEVQAVLLLVRCGAKAVEPYGGMTDAGAESRANYLLKWEAIRTSREQGATSYDMWGLIGTGIDHFKAGFGGREVEYIGAWDLPLSGLGARAFRAAEEGRRLYRAGRRRLRGEDLALPPAPGSDG